MKTIAAVLRDVHQDWLVEEIEVHPPQPFEVLVEWKVAGLCHSDEHVVTGDVEVGPSSLDGLDGFFPAVGGHEGAGVVVEVGAGVTTVGPGDHVSASFVPACGRCWYCVGGKQNLCDYGAGTLMGGMITDGTARHFTSDGTPLTLFAKLGTFSNHTCVAENSLVKVDRDLPMEVVALISCGVATGWGSATVRADVRPGDTVVVVGVGGVGMNAVQGAASAGARHVIAIDPVGFKRDRAPEFGATHVFDSMESAMGALTDMTMGRMANKVIMTPSVMHGDLLELGTKLAGKGGTIVVTALAPTSQRESAIDLFELAMWNKEVKGTIFGSLNPRNDIPRLLEFYRDGRLKVDQLITGRYPLADINDGYRAMRQGETLRGVIVYG